MILSEITGNLCTVFNDSTASAKVIRASLPDELLNQGESININDGEFKIVSDGGALSLLIDVYKPLSYTIDGVSMTVADPGMHIRVNCFNIRVMANTAITNTEFETIINKAVNEQSNPLATQSNVINNMLTQGAITPAEHAKLMEPEKKPISGKVVFSLLGLLSLFN